MLLFPISGYAQTSIFDYLENEILEYKDGDYKSLLAVTSTDFLATAKDTPSLIYWNKYEHLVHAYLLNEKWDLAYLMIKDMSQRIGNVSQLNEHYLRSLTIRGYLENILGYPEEASGWFSKAQRLAQRSNISESTRVFLSGYYADYLIQTTEYSAAQRLLNQVMFSFKTTEGRKDIYVSPLLRYCDLLIDLNDLEGARKLHKDITPYLNPLNRHWTDHSLLIMARLDMIPSLESFEMSFNQMEARKLLIDLKTRIQANEQGVNGLINKLNELEKKIPFSIHIKEFLLLKGDHQHLMGNYDEAVTYYFKALELLKNDYSPEHFMNQLINQKLAISFWTLGNIKQATKYMDRASRFNLLQYKKQFAFLSDRQKELFYDSQREYENILGSFVVENYQNYPQLTEKFMNHLLSFKGMLFNYSYDISLMVSNNDQLRKLYKEYLDTKSRLGIVKQALDYGFTDVTQKVYDSLSFKTVTLEREISLRSFLTGVNGSNVVPNTWETIKSNLNEEEALIDIFKVNIFNPVTSSQDTAHSKYIFLKISKKDQKPKISVLEGNQIETQLSVYRNTIKYKLEDKKSFSVLWEPLVSEFDLSQYSHLIIVPDGAYNLINLGSLYKEGSTSYLIDQWSFTLIGNSGDILKRSLKVESIRNGLFMGFPKFGEENDLNSNQRSSRTTRMFGMETISQLPGTEIEINSLGNLFTSASLDFEKYTYENATESQLKEKLEQSNRITTLHLATHGFFTQGSFASSDHMENSGLLFAGAQYAFDTTTVRNKFTSINQERLLDDGVLLSKEAMDLNLLGTHMVVLSACETGLGIVKEGEGVYGLHRAFQAAGAQSVIMSLWKVDDNATQFFMTSFYENWIETNDKTAAFRKAQLLTKNKFKHPFYWAAFSLVGR